MSTLRVNPEQFGCSGFEKMRGAWTNPDMLSLSYQYDGKRTQDLESYRPAWGFYKRLVAIWI